MTSTPCSAPRCAFPALNGFLCRSCADRFYRDLRELPGLLLELEVTLARLDKLSESEGRSSDERPLPLRLHAVEVRRDVHTTLAAWAAHTAGRFEGLDRTVIWTETRLAQYLLDHAADILTDPAAGQCADEIGYARGMVQRAIDKPIIMTFVGPCDDCGKDLYAHPAAAEVTCRNPECGRIYPIDARRVWLLGKAEDHLLSAAAMSRALPDLLQVKLTADMIKGYARRGRLTQHPAHPKRPNDPLYRVGDVRDLIFGIVDGAERGPKGLVRPRVA